MTDGASHRVDAINEDRRVLGLVKSSKKTHPSHSKQSTGDVASALQLISELKQFVKDCGGVAKVRAALEISEQFGEVVGMENQIEQLDRLEEVL